LHRSFLLPQKVKIYAQENEEEETVYYGTLATYPLCFIAALTLFNCGHVEGKDQIATSNKQNLKMKPADAQRLPSHKIEKKLSLQEPMMSL
jgi:hypothetical protein